MILVCGIRGEGVMTFTNFRVPNLIELIKMHKEEPQPFSG